MRSIVGFIIQVISLCVQNLSVEVNSKPSISANAAGTKVLFSDLISARNLRKIAPSEGANIKYEPYR